MVQLADMFSQREYKFAHLNKEIIGKLYIIDQGWDNAIKSVFAQYVDSVSTLQTQPEILETKTLYMDNRCFLYIYTGGIFFLKIKLYILVDDGWYKAGFPPHEKTKQYRTGVTQLCTWTKRGGIWTDTWVCLHYWVVIWVAG